jgi:glycosyltransferase involved in cell wall biosynthesis
MNLAVFPNRGSSLADLARSGQLERFTGYYLPAYTAGFSRVFYLSYDADIGYRLPRGCELLAAPVQCHPLLYSLRMAAIHQDALRQCHVARVLQMTGAIPALIAKRRLGLPFAATYGYRYGELIRPTRRRASLLLTLTLERVGLRAADAVIVTTPELIQYVTRWVASQKVHLIPNGVDTEIFRPPAQPPSNDRPSVIFVGRLEPQKNLVALLEAVAEVENLHLTLIGDGTQRRMLIQRARELAVDMTLTGVVPYRQLPERLQQADVFVLPSHMEGHPKALLEAMSVALPCVGTDVPGTRDLLQDNDTGILCDGTDAASLAAGLRRILADRERARRLGLAARALVEAQYDLRVLLKRETDLLQCLAARGG